MNSDASMLSLGRHLQIIPILFCLMLIGGGCQGGRWKQPHLGFSAASLEDVPAEFAAQAGPIEDLRQPLKEQDYGQAIALAENMLARTQNSTYHDRLSFVLATLYLRTKNWKKTLDILSNIQYRTPYHDTLGDYVALYKGTAYLELKLPEKAIPEFQNIIRWKERSRFEADGLLGLGKAYYDTKTYDKASSNLRTFRERFPQANHLDEALFLEAKSLVNLQQFETAATLLMTLYLKYPNSSYAQNAWEYHHLLRQRYPQIAHIAPKFEDLYNRGVKLQDVQNYTKARREFEELKKLGELNPDQIFDLEFSVARTYFLSRQYPKALDRFLALHTTCPAKCPPTSTDLLLYWIGRTYTRLSNYERATFFYQTLLDTYPKSNLAESVYFNLASMAQEQKQFPRSIALYDDYLKRYPSGQFHESASWFIAWQLIMQKRYREAVRHLDTIKNIKNNDILLSAIHYWKGYCFEKLRQYENAFNQYQELIFTDPLSYYYELAQKRITNLLANQKLNPQFLERAPLSEVAFAPETFNIDLKKESIHTSKARFYFRRGITLLECGLSDLASDELLDAQIYTDKTYPNLFQLARLFLATRSYHRAHYLTSLYLSPLITHRERDDIIGTLLRLSFPRAHKEYVESNLYNVSPALVYAIMREESHFNTRVISQAGAVGLMQLLPETGTLISRRVKLPDYTTESLTNPKINIQFGAWYLKFLLTKFNGDMTYAIAAYNAGPAAVDDWIELFGNLDKDYFIEMIPYRETRHYVKRVLRSYGIYAWLYEQQPTDNVMAQTDQETNLPFKGETPQ